MHTLNLGIHRLMNENSKHRLFTLVEEGDDQQEEMRESPPNRRLLEDEEEMDSIRWHYNLLPFCCTLHLFVGFVSLFFQTL